MGALVDAASSGDRKAQLVALRDQLAHDIEQASADGGRGVAALAEQYRKTLAELVEFEAPEEKSTTDDLAAKRDERRRRAAETPQRSRSADVGGG